MIKCEDLKLGYDKQIVCENISFDIKANDYLCILGENGAGKSTLMKTLLGLNPLLGGKISYNEGFDKKNIGYLPQQSAIQKEFPTSVWEIVLSGTLAKSKSPFYTKENKKLANEMIEKLHIENLKNKCYKNLSGGQQQRVLIARALCASSEILLLDEPITGLDPIAINEFYELTKELNNNGVTIIMISHDMQSIEYANKILFIGRKENYFGTKEEFVSNKYDKLFKGDVLC